MTRTRSKHASQKVSVQRNKMFRKKNYQLEIQEIDQVSER